MCTRNNNNVSMFRCAQVHQVAAHVEKALGMQVNWLLNNTNASPHMRTNWRVLMYLSKARHVQGFLVVEQIGSAFKTTAPCSLRRDSVVTYDTSSRTPAQLGIRVRTAHSLPKHPFILIRTRDSSHRIEVRKTPCIITYLSRPRLVDGKKKKHKHMCRSLQGLWVHQSCRREGIATTLVHTARSTLAAGYTVPLSLCAFSQPTVDGQLFAVSYCDSEKYLVYTARTDVT